MRALYAHKGKVQDGFTLMGFEKGDEMVLLIKREDGWSKVQNGDDVGWAPTSYLKELPAEAPAAPAAAAKKPAKKPAAEVSPAQAVSEFKELLQAAVAIAQKIQKRDKELAALSNAMVSWFGMGEEKRNEEEKKKEK